MARPKLTGKAQKKEIAQRNAAKAAAAAAAASKESDSEGSDGESGEDDEEYDSGDEEKRPAGGSRPASVDPALALSIASGANATEDSDRTASGVLYSEPTSKDVKVGQFSLSRAGKSLIEGAELEFTIGRRYGLMGPNGSGKSTLLRCLAEREVPIPKMIDIFFLDREAPPEDVTPLEAVVRHAEAAVERMEEEMEAAIEELGPDHDVVQDLIRRLDDMEPEMFRAKAGRLLHGLGFDELLMARKTRDLSGGWRMRVSLAQALFVKPTLLLLDDPTAHLDVPGVVFLERELAKYDRCLVMVSHSTEFLDNVCTNIMEITPDRKLRNWGGNYSAYRKAYADWLTNTTTQYNKQQDQIQHTKAIAAAAGTYKNMVRRAKSRQKILDKMLEKDGVIELPKEHQANYNFHFQEVDPLPPPVMAFHDVTFRYNETQPYIFKHLDLAVNTDSRIALVGANGAGKSTLLKLMLGQLSPTEGMIKRHLHLSLGHFNQHSAETLPLDKSPLEYIASMHPEMKLERDQWRAQLGKFGLRGEAQVTPIYKLSDGVRSRILFALLALSRPNLLVLDEPTNHLDDTSIAALADAIKAFKGGVVVVSHDFALCDAVADEVWVVADHTVTRWDGDIHSYKASLIAELDAYERANAPAKR